MLPHGDWTDLNFSYAWNFPEAYLPHAVNFEISTKVTVFESSKVEQNTVR